MADALTFTIPVHDNIQANNPSAKEQAPTPRCTVILAQFQPKVILDLGEFLPKHQRHSSGVFVLRNPSGEQPLDVTLVKWPQDGSFDVSETKWTLQPETSQEVRVTWTPQTQGRIRELFEFEFVCRRKVGVQAYVMGDATRLAANKQQPKSSSTSTNKTIQMKLISRSSSIRTQRATTATTSSQRQPKQETMSTIPDENRRTNHVGGTRFVIGDDGDAQGEPPRLSSRPSKLHMSKAAQARPQPDARLGASSPLKPKSNNSSKSSTIAAPRQQRNPNKRILSAAAAGTSRRGLKLPGGSSSNLQQSRRMNSHTNGTSTNSQSNKLLHFDRGWQEKQEQGFTSWINYLVQAAPSAVPDHDGAGVAPVTPPTSAEQHQQQQQGGNAFAGELDRITGKNAHAVLAQKQREAATRRRAFAIYHSQDLESVMFNVEKEVSSQGLVIRQDRQLYKDLGLRDKFLTILGAYQPEWMRVGLETVLGEVINLSYRDIARDQGRSVLSRIIVDRVLSDPDIVASFRETKRGIFTDNTEYLVAMARFTLNRFLMLVTFLDQAKVETLLDFPGCLFVTDKLLNPLNIRSSKEAIIEFAKEFLQGEGNILKHLKQSCGYELFHVQSPLDEFDFFVNNIAVDLRDGVRLTRLVEILTNNYARSLSKRLRVPVVSRLQKLHNVSVALDDLDKQGLDFAAGRRGKIVKGDIVNGDRDKTLALLWKMICKWKLSVLVTELDLSDEIARVLSEHGPTATSIFERAQEEAAAELHVREVANERAASETAGNDGNSAKPSSMERLLLRWCQVVCAHHGEHVSNFTTGMASGRALCLLIHHYHPGLLPQSGIHATTADLASQAPLSNKESQQKESANGGRYNRVTVDRVQYKQAILNERANFRLVNQCALDLGCVPMLLPDFDSDNVPEPKLMSVFIAYLCARMLDARNEIHAAMTIQKYWAQYYHAKYSVQRGLASRLMQRIVRGGLARTRVRAILYRKQQAEDQHAHAAALVIQSAARRMSSCRVAQHERFSKELLMMANRRLLLMREANKHKLDMTVRLQNWWRMILLQDIHLETRKLVLDLQSLVRAKPARDHYRRLRGSVIVVQSLARVVMAANKTELRKNAVVRVQSFVRMSLDKLHFVDTRDAVVILQSVARRRAAVCTAQGLRTCQHRAAQRIQSIVRGYGRVVEWERFKFAVVCVQAVVRASQQRLKYTRMCMAAQVISSHVRMWQCEKQLVDARSAAVMIQSFSRMVVNSGAYQRSLHATKVMQNAVRGWFARKHFASAVQSVVVGQTYVRMFLQRRVYIRLQRASVEVARVWRGHQGRSTAARQRAAVRLQAFGRMVVQRRTYINALVGFTTLQAVVRGDRARVMLAGQRDAASHAQAVVRGRQARQNWQKTQVAIRRLQSFARMVGARRSRGELVLALHVIQCSLRCSLARRTVQRQVCARKIQSVVRGYQAKHAYKSVIARVVTLQSHVRGFQARDEFQVMLRVVVRIQSTMRASLARAYKADAIGRVIVIQKNVRGMFAWKEWNNVRSAGVSVQSVVRGWLARLQLRMQHGASIIVQRWWRTLAQRRKYCDAVVSVVRLQALVRGRAAQRVSQWHLHSVLVVQKTARGFLVHQSLVRQQRAAVVMQAWARQLMSSAALHESRAAAVKLQGFCRRVLACKVADVRFDSALVVQRTARGFLVRRSLEQQQRAAIVVQSWARQLCATAEFNKSLIAVIKVQSFGRQVVARRVAGDRLYNALIVQRTARGFLARQSLEKQQRAAVVVQAWARQMSAMVVFEASLVAVVKVQSFSRQSLARRVASERLYSVLVVQSVARGFFARRSLEQQQRAAVVVQAWARQVSASAVYNESLMTTIKIQAFTRRVLACKVADNRYDSVLVIQKSARDLLVRRSLARQHRAAVVIQALARQLSASAALNESLGAAIKIQAFSRRVQACRVADNRYDSVIYIQKTARGLLVRRSLARQQRAVVVVQAWARQLFAMAALNEALVAAVKLQAFSRQVLACRVADERYGSVLQVQRTARGFLTRQHLAQQHGAAVVVQSWARMSFASSARREALEAAIIIQAFVRRVFACQEARVRFGKVLVIQKTVRGFLARRSLARQQSAAVVVQAWARHVAASAILKASLAAAVKLQAFSRRVLACRAADGRLGQVILIQSVARRWLAFQLVRRHETAVVVLQAWSRTQAGVRLLTRSQTAAVVIQSTVRARHARQQTYTLRAVRRIQSSWRSLSAQRMLRMYVDCAVLIQSHVRCLLSTVQLNMARWAVINIQRTVRARLARKLTNRLRIEATQLYSVLVIQRAAMWRAERRHTTASLHVLRNHHHASVTITRWLVARAQLFEQREQKRVRMKQEQAASVVTRYVRRNAAWFPRYRVQRAVVRLQSVYRGHLVRVEDDRKAQEARARVKLANAQAAAKPEMSLGNRTTSALAWLLQTTSLNEVLHACEQLKRTSTLSVECCETIVAPETGALEVIFQLIKTCNRSEPHIKLVVVLLSILNNCVRKLGTPGVVFSPEESFEVLVDLLQIFRDRTVVLVPAARLVHGFVRRCPADAREFLFEDEQLMKRMNGLVNLMRRKVDVEKRVHGSHASSAQKAWMDGFRNMQAIVDKANKVNGVVSQGGRGRAAGGGGGGVGRRK